MSLSNAKYSIILPVRNGGAYVKECINSILNQTLPDFKLQVLDNCSTDGTREWIESLGDERIAIYPAENPLTIEENWSRITTIPKNEFITLIGHDDILSEFYLEEMSRLIHKHPHASLYQTHFAYIDKDGLITRNCLPMDEIQTAHEFLACQMNRTIDSTGTGYMMRSKDFDDLGGMPQNYPNLIFSDYELWIKLISKGYKATAQKECFQYREHLSVSRTTNGEQYEKAFGEYVKFMSGLKAGPGFDEVISRYGSKMLIYFCESLSHRVLKTPIHNRQMKVKDVIEHFNSYAKILVPGQPFMPLKQSGIRYAILLDRSAITRNAFNIVNRFRR